MRDVVICHPLRTPVGRFGGVFRDVPATALAAAVIEAIVERAGLQPADVDDVMFGQCYPNGEAPAIGRVAALDAGLGIGVPGLQVDRRCGSGLQAVILAAMTVATGAADLVLAGGAESMSQVEFYDAGHRRAVAGTTPVLVDRLARARTTAGGIHHAVPGGMLETAENLRREYRISRREQDELALRSHQRAVAAQRRGDFDDEIVPMTVPTESGSSLVSVDEHPRPETTLDGLAALRPVLGRGDANATVTAGNASGQNDGASVCIVTTAERAAARGLIPALRLRSWAVAGVAPETMGIGPVPATARALERAGLCLGDIGVIELNEAFAAQVLACTREWNFADADFERLNPNGSGIALGHPVGATGGRILATLAHEMRRHDVEFGLETMCIGGGQGLAAVFALVA
jgi:acetyl-CoA C-acetyltransferase